MNCTHILLRFAGTVAIASLSALSIAPVAAAQAVAGKAPAGSGATRKSPAGPPRLTRVSGPDPTHLMVSTVSPLGTNPKPTGISGIQLLQLEVSGRTALEVTGAGGGRAQPLLFGQAVVLPGPYQNRVYLYRRTGTAKYGLFASTATGGVRVLIERNGLGPGASLSPFYPAIGVSPDGHTIAVAAADYSQGIGGIGDAWLIRVDGQPLGGVSSSLVELTGPGEQEVSGLSLRFVGDRLYAVEEGRLVSAPADGSGGFVPLPVSLPGNFEITEEVLLSKDAASLWFLAGPDEDIVDLYRLTLQGLVLDNITQSPGAIQPPGYLPETETGPHLSFSEDGATVAYDVEIANGHELFVRATSPGGSVLHVTPDPNFEHSIDNVSGLSAGGAKFRFFADSGQLNADLYEVGVLPGGGLGLKNLTQTSGVATPFFPNLATIDVHETRSCGAARWIVDDRSGVGAGYDLWAVTASGMAGRVESGLATPPEFVDHDLMVLAMTRGPVSNRLFRIDEQAAPVELLSVPSAVTISSPALSPNGSVAALTLAALGTETPVRLDTDTGSWLSGSSTLANVHGLSFSGNSRLLFSAASGVATGTFVMDVASGSEKEIGAPAPVAFWIR